MTDFLEQDATTAEARAAEAAGAGLSPLAITHEALLRELAVNGAPETLTALAEAAGVRVSNINRDLRLLDTAGLLTLQPLAVTDKGHNALAALALYRARVEGHADDPAPAPLGDLPLQGLPHAAIAPDGFNPRKAFDEDGLAELAASIALDGLLQPLVVRPPADGAPPGTPHRLVAGERRWRAIGALIADGRWPADRPVPVTLRDMDDETHLRLAIIENLQRRELKPLEEARAFRRLQDEFNLSTAEIAKQIGFGQRMVQQRLQLLDLNEEDAQRLDAGKITIEDARRRIANYPKVPDLTPRQWLVAIEAIDAAWARREAGETLATSSIHVQPEAEEDPDRQALSTSSGIQLFGYIGEEYDDGFKTGLRQVSIWSWGQYQIAHRFPDLNTPEGRAAALATVRREAGAEGDFAAGVYATAWLNGPFEISDADRARMAEERAQRDRDNEQRRADQQARRERLDQAALLAAALVDRHRRGDHAPGEFTQVMTGLDRVLPWSVDPRTGNILDGLGHVAISTNTSYGAGPPSELIARHSMIALAVNAAAGLVTPEPPAAEEQADPASDLDADDRDEALADDEAA